LFGRLDCGRSHWKGKVKGKSCTLLRAEFEFNDGAAGRMTKNFSPRSRAIAISGNRRLFDEVTLGHRQTVICLPDHAQ
jgi:hypothetical protein